MICNDYSIEHGKPTKATLPICNVNRAVGTILGNEITKNTGMDSPKIPSISTSKVVPDKASAHSSPKESPSNSKAMPTTTSAKDSAAVKSSSTPRPNPPSSRPKTSSSATSLSTEPPAVKSTSTAWQANGSASVTLG
jgi:hypothetical protein